MRVAHISMNIEYFIDNNVEAETGNTGHINNKMTVAAAAVSAIALSITIFQSHSI